VNGLHEELDQALRTLPVGEPPVERTRRDGGRLRARRRAASLAGAVVVVAAAACYPVLAGGARPAAVTPVTGSATALPSSSKTLANGDAVVTDGPAATATMGPDGMTDKSGLVAQGTVGGAAWQVSVSGPGPANAVAGDSCYTFNLADASILTSGCADLSAGLLDQVQSGDPAAFTGTPTAAANVTVGVVGDDVTYFIVTFTDGQQLKLLPVTVAGHRYIAWIVPENLVVATVEAHLGGPYNDSGQVATAAPFARPGSPPLFGLWQRAGQSAPPRDTRVIGAGRTAGKDWNATADEGPWGTCVVTSAGGAECVPVAQLTHTGVLGIVRAGTSGVGWGAAAPGVTRVKIALSNGTTVEARPVGVGNEDLFAFWTGPDVSDRSWTAYNAAGQPVGHGVSK
jgi:hypothetical protein